MKILHQRKDRLKSVLERVEETDRLCTVEQFMRIKVIIKDSHFSMKWF
jgi:hypothetical protein